MSSTNRGAKRIAADFYPTPLAAFKPLLPYLIMHREPVWEPCCGDGRLVKSMQDSGIAANGADIRDIPSYDFLRDTRRHKRIVTNPPFSLAKEFCDHAIKHSDSTIMLLRLNFLGSKKRKEWWKANEPDAIFVLSKRPDFTGDGGDSCEYGWFCWNTPFTGIIHL